MARIEISACAYILSLRLTGAGPGNGRELLSFWTEGQIELDLDGANYIWRQAEIKFVLRHREPRNKTVSSDAGRMYTQLLNQLPRIPGCPVVMAFVHELSAHLGGFAGGRLALVGEHLRTTSLAARGAVLAHELGHVLNLTDRHGLPDGNLMYHSINLAQPNRRLDPPQIEVARRRASELSGG
jgi:hypothetical protein